MVRQVFVFSIILAFAAVTGCSSTPKYASQSRTATSSNSYNHQPRQLTPSKVQQLLTKQYYAWKGVPYRIGGNDKRGVDCSGFVHIAYKNALGMHLPRTTKKLAQTGKTIASKELNVGDLVFFKTGYKKRHVGIYIGDGQFIHASTSKGVMKSQLSSPYWSKHYWKSTRVIEI